MNDEASISYTMISNTFTCILKWCNSEREQCSERLQRIIDHITYLSRMSLHNFPPYILPLAQVRRPGNLRAKKKMSNKGKWRKDRAKMKKRLILSNPRDHAVMKKMKKSLLHYQMPKKTPLCRAVTNICRPLNGCGGCICGMIFLEMEFARS